MEFFNFSEVIVHLGGTVRDLKRAVATEIERSIGGKKISWYSYVFAKAIVCTILSHNNDVHVGSMFGEHGVCG